MFYVDQEHTHNHYSQFIGEELVEMTRAMFPLSHKKEDTFILSRGRRIKENNKTINR